MTTARESMQIVGKGVREIRIREGAGAFRVIYLAKFEDAVYVLHCFQKKTEKTAASDIGLVPHVRIKRAA